jgi:hypothetical protein
MSRMGRDKVLAVGRHRVVLDRGVVATREGLSGIFWQGSTGIVPSTQIAGKKKPAEAGSMV